ncbi:MAG: hypothetical protein RLZ98_3530, partial [Pseudomonadota bacterium]
MAVGVDAKAVGAALVMRLGSLLSDFRRERLSWFVELVILFALLMVAAIGLGGITNLT